MGIYIDHQPTDDGRRRGRRPFRTHLGDVTLAEAEARAEELRQCESLAGYTITVEGSDDGEQPALPGMEVAR